VGVNSRSAVVVQVGAGIGAGRAGLGVDLSWRFLGLGLVGLGLWMSIQNHPHFFCQHPKSFVKKTTNKHTTVTNF